jgi:hypothetical protein
MPCASIARAVRHAEVHTQLAAAVTRTLCCAAHVLADQQGWYRQWCSPILVDIKVVEVLLQGSAAWWGGVVPLGALLAGHLVVSGHIWGV